MTERLREAARRAHRSLCDLIAEHPDPGTEALAARFELEQALANTAPAAVPVLPSANQTTDRAAALSDTERQFLTFALDLAVGEMASRGNEFGDEDTVALAKLRRVADEVQPTTKPEPDDEPFAGDGRRCIACGDSMRSHIRQGAELVCAFCGCSDPVADEAPQPGAVTSCGCGEPPTPGTVHRMDGPCYIAETPQPETQAATCGRTKSVCDTEYPPCARPAGHEEAYCRSADGKQHFLAVDAPAGVAQPGKEA